MRRNFLVLRFLGLLAGVGAFALVAFPVPEPFHVDLMLIGGIAVGLGVFLASQLVIAFVQYRCPSCRKSLAFGAWTREERELGRFDSDGYNMHEGAVLLEFLQLETLFNRPHACPHCTADFQEVV